MNDQIVMIVNPQTSLGWITWVLALVSGLFFLIYLIQVEPALEKEARKKFLFVCFMIFAMGIFAGFVLTHSLYTAIEVLGFYLLIISFLKKRKYNFQGYSKVSLWEFAITSRILSFAISLLMAEEPLAVRFDYALMQGFVRWMVLFILSLLILGIYGVAKKRRIIDFRTSLFSRQPDGWLRFLRGNDLVIFTIGIFLFANSLIWGIVKPVMMRGIDQEFLTQFEDLSEKSYVYYETGQALVQLTDNALQDTPGIQVSEQDLIEIINRFPLFSHLLVLKGNQVTASYPSEELLVTIEWIQEICNIAGKTGTYVGVFQPNLDTVNSMATNAFVAATSDGMCTVGLATYEDTLFFTTTINRINLLSTDWAFMDQIGGGIVYGRTGIISSLQKSFVSLVSPRFSNVYMGGSFVPMVQWQHHVVDGQWQHHLSIIITPKLLMQRLAPAFLASSIITGILVTSFMASLVMNRKKFLREITLVNEQIDRLTAGDLTLPGSYDGEDPKTSSLAGSIAALTKFHQHMSTNRQLIAQIERICEAESVEALIHHLKNDATLRSIGEFQLTIQPYMTNQTVINISPRGMAIPPFSPSKGEPVSDHSHYGYFLDREVSGQLIHRYVFHMDQKLLGIFSCMHKEETLSRIDQEYLDTIAKQISQFLCQLKLKEMYQSKDTQWRQVFENFPFPAMMLNNQMALLEINHKARIMGFINEKSIAKNAHLTDFVANSDMVEIIQHAILSQSASPSVNFVENGRFIVHVSKISGNDHDKDSKHIIWFQDISEAREKFTVQANILASTIHRLRSELDIVQGKIHLLTASGPLNQSQALHYKEISRSLDELKAFLQASSFEDRFSSETGLAFRPVNLIDIIIQAIRTLKPFADQNKVVMSFANKSEQADVTVMADQMVLLEVFKHLIDNAIRYNTIGGYLSIVVEEDESVVTVTVHDTGVGLSALDLARINSDQALTVSAEGSIKFGTGLRLAKSVIAKHGGKLSVNSILGEGSTFYITIPKRT